ncbi:acetyl-CoA carboxylase biotin carboxyl carrier protein [Actinomycetospora aeridis]|uniref:Biotin carboxyl carrier protein of acetyl-CoA carboxylase n=1 Tax=Actinomycetospora aeridis TaxID=3129231 RepID=A0ABU8N7W6_9PSEU
MITHRNGVSPVDEHRGDPGQGLEALRDTAVSLAGALPERPARIRVASGTESIEVEWGTGGEPAGSAPTTPAPAPAAVPGPAPAPASASAPAPVPAGPAVTIVAPLVGTFYGAPSPGEPPFVAVGDTVHPGQQVAIVEAMKLMNAVHADRGGVVTAVRVSDGEMVEFGQVLVELDHIADGD